MASRLEELRKTLHEVVDGAWAAPEMLEVKDALGKTARDAGYQACVKELWEKGTVTKKALEDCAKKTDIGKVYRAEWGKPT